MPICVFWAINGILWAVAINLVWLGSYKCVKARHKLRMAKWSSYSTMTQETIDRYKDMDNRYKDLIKRVNKDIETYRELGDIEGMEWGVSAVKDFNGRLEDVSKSLLELNNQQVEYANKGGIPIPQYISIFQIDATVRSGNSNSSSSVCAIQFYHRY